MSILALVSELLHRRLYGGRILSRPLTVRAEAAVDVAREPSASATLALAMRNVRGGVQARIVSYGWPGKCRGTFSTALGAAAMEGLAGHRSGCFHPSLLLVRDWLSHVVR